MASASMLTENIAGLSVDEARGRIRMVIDQIGARAAAGGTPRDEWLEALVSTVREFPTRAGCATLPWITLDAALDGQPTAVTGS
jgi:NifU-like protein involved in Fe-S cluster formation